MTQEYECPTFTKHADGRITVDRFPDRILLDHGALDGADPTWVTIEGSIVTFNVSNGEATYRITGPADGWSDRVYAAERVPADE